MKILFVNECCGYMGGVEQNIADVVTGLSARGHECHLAYGIVTSSHVEKYSSLFVSCIRIRELCTAPSQATSGTPFEETLHTLQPDVIYLHKVPTLKTLGLEKTNIKTVRMIHDYDVTCPRKHKYYAMNGQICTHKAGAICWFDLAFMEHAPFSMFGVHFVNLPEKIHEIRRQNQIHVIIAGSTAMRHELIQNGIDTNKIRVLAPVVPMIEKKMTPPPKDYSLLYVGQLIRGKGVDLLLKSLAKLTIPFQVTIIGQGNASDRLRTLTKKLGLDRQVEFLGWVNREDIHNYYVNSRVVVVPSRWPEPFGMIGLEAMRHGRAVVAFNVGGIPDWLEHEKTGLLVAPQNTQAMADAIERILTQPSLAETYGQNGYESVHTKFGFDQYISELEKVLQP
ncbi:MAG: glycosyltransferase family 4 protein [Candidatus Omnitrophica bacterium]|nr:glycosyltransferase family 4 protein [Candidatus Omnitrophota bacterium]